MTEAEWVECSDPIPMLQFLHEKGSDRKLRLFNCVSCRRIWHLLNDERTRRAVETAERFADQLATCDELAEAANAGDDAAQKAYLDIRRCAPDADAAYAAAASAYNDADANVEYVQMATAHAGGVYQITYASLLRDLLGPLLFRQITTSPGLLSWNDSTIPKIAQAIYDERAFDRLPILADALEDAGCDNADILNHCREPGEHVRGCWVVDLLLGKE